MQRICDCGLSWVPATTLSPCCISIVSALINFLLNLSYVPFQRIEKYFRINCTFIRLNLFGEKRRHCLLNVLQLMTAGMLWLRTLEFQVWQ